MCVKRERGRERTWENGMGMCLCVCVEREREKENMGEWNANVFVCVKRERREYMGG